MSAPESAAADVDLDQRTSMAAERTWLAWWRTALTATAGALGVGRLAPELLGGAPGPYIGLGLGYAALAIGLLVVGSWRQRELARAQQAGVHAPLSFTVIAVFTAGGVALVLMTMLLVAAQL